MTYIPTPHGPRASAIALAIAGAAALAGLPSAAGAAQLRHIPGTGHGLAPTTVAPDLRSVEIDPTNNLDDAIGERARFCFDSQISKATGVFVLQSYDARRWWQGTGSVAADNQNCAIVTFPKGSDIAQATVGSVRPGAVSDVANKANIVASEPVTGSVARPVAGATTGPDLIDATVDGADPANRIVTYTFDENLNPSPSRGSGSATQAAYEQSDFGYAGASGAPVYAPAGKVLATGNTVKVNFKSAPVDTAARFVTKAAAVEDRPQTNVQDGSGLSLFTASPPGVVIKSGETGGRPYPIKAEPAGANTYKVTFNTGVAGWNNTGFTAIADDGTVSATSLSAGTGGSQDTVLVTFPDSSALTKDPGSIVRIVAANGAVSNSTDANAKSIYGDAATQTPNNTPGYTNGPDLLGVSVDAATQRTSFVYDEAVAPSTPSANFLGFRPDTTSGPGTGATASGGNGIAVIFGAGIGDYVAYGQNYGAVKDAIGRPSPAQSVSKDAEAQPTPPPPPPVASGQIKVSTKVSLRRAGSRFSGTLSAAQTTCKYNRTVILRKKGKSTTRFGTARSLVNGRFGLTKSRPTPGTYYVFVVAKKTSKFSCGSVTSKQTVRVR